MAPAAPGRQDQVDEPIEPAGLAEGALGPCDAGRHRCVPLHQIRVAGRVGRRLVRRRLLAGDDVAVGVAADERDPGQRLQLL